MVFERKTITLNIHPIAKCGRPGELTWVTRPAIAPLVDTMRALISVEGKTGWIRLYFKHADGEELDQSFEVVAVPSSVGGIKWYGNFIDAEGLGFIKYSKIYLAPEERLFTPRHGLKRRSRDPVKYHLDRAIEIAKDLGLKSTHDVPVEKPNGMSDREFARLSKELERQDTLWMCAARGLPPPDFGDEEDQRAIEAYYEREARKQQRKNRAGR